MNITRDWLRRSFTDPQVVGLLLLLAGCLAVGFFFGDVLVPVFVSIIVAYLLEGLVGNLRKRKIPRPASVYLVFFGFSFLIIIILTFLVPVLLQQGAQLGRQLPLILTGLQKTLLRLPELYPDLISEEEIRQVIALMRTGILNFAQTLVPFSLVTATYTLAYLILTPLLVFFFMRDKQHILSWLGDMLPGNLDLVVRVWKDVDLQIGNYMRGKAWEIAIVWAITAATFAILDLQFPILISFMVGLSVLVPYFGAAAMTGVVLMMAYVQWGYSLPLLYVMVAYVVIQLLDGNLLAPLLISASVKLHPVSIIVAILIFGKLWGAWGVLLAVPLTTMLQAVIQSWPYDTRETNGP